MRKGQFDGDGVVVLARGLGGRSDLPVPLWLAMYAGAFLFAVFLVAAWFGPVDAGQRNPAPTWLAVMVGYTTAGIALQAGA